MSKIATLLAALLVISGTALGQNLVPNGSFEIHTSCPSVENQLGYATPWFSPSTAGTPDYFNQCSTSSQLGVPHNASGCQLALSADGYAGIYLWKGKACINFLCLAVG